MKDVYESNLIFDVGNEHLKAAIQNLLILTLMDHLKLYFRWQSSIHENKRLIMHQISKEHCLHTTHKKWHFKAICMFPDLPPKWQTMAYKSYRRDLFSGPDTICERSRPSKGKTTWLSIFELANSWYMNLKLIVVRML